MSGLTCYVGASAHHLQPGWGCQLYRWGIHRQQGASNLNSLLRRFFRDTRYFWLGCTQFPPCNYPVSRGLRLLYALELAYYTQVWGCFEATPSTT